MKPSLGSFARVALFVAAVVVLFSLSSGAAEPAVIRMIAANHPAVTAIRELSTEFTQATGIKVVIEEVPCENIPEKLMLMFSRKGTDYDVIEDDWAFHAIAYAKGNFLEPLDSLIAADDVNLSVYMPTFVKDLRFGGNQMGIPLYGESTFLMYRKDLFDEYGLKAPDTMEEMMEAAKSLTLDLDKDGQTDIYGITMRGRRGIHIVYTWAGFLWGFGGRWFDDDWNPVFNSPEAIEATDFYVDILSKFGPPGASNYGWEENRIAFEQGRAAMTIDATVNGAMAEDPSMSKIAGNVGYVVVPKQATRGASVATHGMYISKFSKNKAAAWEFVKWATSVTTQTKAFETHPHSGVTIASILESRQFKDRYPFAEALVESLEIGITEYIPRIPETYEVATRVGIALSEVLSGQRSAREALDAAAKDVKDIMTRSGYYE